LAPSSVAQASTSHLGPDGLYVGAPGRSFGEAIAVCLKKYATFSGRASRSEYWYFALFVGLMNIGASILDTVVFGMTFEDYGLFYAITSLGLALPALASGWRRLHDTNRSGWWFGGFVVAMVVAVITFAVMAAEGGDPEAALGFGILLAAGGLIFAITILFFYIQKGQPHPNRFG
jgi:uncharacterized membrane protein YhaH (DUF805 family)